MLFILAKVKSLFYKVAAQISGAEIWLNGEHYNQVVVNLPIVSELVLLPFGKFLLLIGFYSQLLWFDIFFHSMVHK
jgi:hypothetical protein